MLHAQKPESSEMYEPQKGTSHPCRTHVYPRMLCKLLYGVKTRTCPAVTNSGLPTCLDDEKNLS
jgi:hypothetical protein